MKFAVKACVFVVICILFIAGCAPSKPKGTVEYVLEPYVQNVTGSSAVIVWETKTAHEGFVLVNED